MISKKVIGGVIVFLVLLSIFCIWLSFAFKQEIPNKEYNFHVLWGGSDQGYIRDFLFEYNFKHQIGSLGFRIFNYQYMENFELALPEELEIYTYELNEDGYTISNAYCIYENHNSSILCSNLQNKTEYNLSVKVKERNNSRLGGFYPNGIFYLVFPSLDSTTKYSMDFRSSSLFIFDLGGRYRCSERCVNFELGDANLTYNANKDFFRVYPIINDAGNVGRFNRFVINMYNLRQEKWSNIFLALGISILSGVILLLFNLLFPLENKKDLNKRIK